MKKNSPKVLIIILNWNNASDTIKCLKSLQKIDYQNYEVLVIDNGFGAAYVASLINTD